MWREWVPRPAAPVQEGGFFLLSISRVLVDPGGLPGLAAIYPECLLRSGRIMTDTPHGESHQYRLAVDRLLVIELDTPFAEFADAWNTQRSTAGRREVNRPLFARRVVEPEREQLDMPTRAICYVFREIRAPAPHFADVCHTLDRRPRGRSGQRLLQTRCARLPGAVIEIEVVAAVMSDRR